MLENEKRKGKTRFVARSRVWSCCGVWKKLPTEKKKRGVSIAVGAGAGRRGMGLAVGGSGVEQSTPEINVSTLYAPPFL
jgi:hypothetical protein